jgi:hypothetical protein
MTSQCRAEFGGGARMCTSQEILDSDTHNFNAIPTTGCWIRPVFQPFQNGGNIPLALDASGSQPREPTELTCLAWSGGHPSVSGLTLDANGAFLSTPCDVPRAVACCKPTPVPAPSASLSLPIGTMGLLRLSMLKGSV